MDTKDLHAFKTIVECGTFSKAAARLRIAQPALSRKIQKIEHDLGVQLLRRAARGVTPTAAGHALLQRAIKFEHEFEELHREMARHADRATGLVRVAVQTPLSLIMVPELLRQFQTSHPGVTLELTEGFSGDLIDGLLNEQLDLVVADTPTHPHADLTDTRLWVEPLLLVGRPGSLPAARDGNGNLPLRELAGLPVIMPCQRHAIRRLVDAAFDRQRLRFKPAIEANGALMILQLVKTGFGYTLMPSNRVYPWVKNGELEAVGIRPVLRRTMSVITRTEVMDDPRVASLRAVVLSLAPEIARRKQFSPTTRYLSETTGTPVAAMPDRYNEPERTALVSA